MFRIAVNQFSKRILPTKYTVESVRPIFVYSGLQQNKSKEQEIAEKKQRDGEMRWTRLYHFKDIKFHAIVTRLKIYPLISTVVLTPIAFVVDAMNIIPDFTYVPCFAVGVTASIMLSAYSKALENTIGLIYICKENKNLQIAYIDFLGRQHFIETTVDQVQTWNKSPVKFGFYKTIYAESGTDRKELKMSLRKVDIYDNKLFRRLFGK